MVREMALRPLLDLDDVQEYASERIVEFDQQRMRLLQDLTFQELLEEGFCLFRPMRLGGDIVEGLLEAFLCSSGEQLFEDLLKDLSVFVARKTCGRRRSTMPGVDLEFENEGVYHIVLVKSGLNWGNSSQQKKLAQDLRNAVIRVKQSRNPARIEPVLGICYGETRTKYAKAGYLEVVGQNFWYLISENRDLYTDIIEPIGYRAKEHNDAFYAEKARVVNRFTREFIDGFCHDTGAIDWMRLVEFNSGNYDLDGFLP
jgi:hypothetical protein